MSELIRVPLPGIQTYNEHGEIVDMLPIWAKKYPLWEMARQPAPLIHRDLPPPLASDELNGMAQVDHQWKEHTMYSIDLFLETLYMQKDIDPGYILLNQADYRELAHLIWQGTNYRGTSFENSLRHAQTRWINQTTGNLMKIAIDEMLPPDTIRFFYEVKHEQ